MKKFLTNEEWGLFAKFLFAENPHMSNVEMYNRLEDWGINKPVNLIRWNSQVEKFKRTIAALLCLKKSPRLRHFRAYAPFAKDVLNLAKALKETILPPKRMNERLFEIIKLKCEMIEILKESIVTLTD